MNRYLQSALVAALGVASMTCALAQEPAAPANPREPTAAQTPAPPSTTDRSTTTSPNRQAAADSKESHKQMMKDCVAKEKAGNTSMTTSEAKKNCKAQMKSNSSSPKSY